jgi:hypothetical protein
VTAVPAPDLRALVAGETVVIFVPRNTVDVGDEIELARGADRPVDDVKAAYGRWADAEMPPGPWTGIVVSLDPAALLDPATGASRHVLTSIPDGDLAVVRVYGPDGPVLSDETFEARRRSVEGAIEA